MPTVVEAGDTQRGLAWVALTLSLAAHVADEALTGFASAAGHVAGAGFQAATRRSASSTCSGVIRAAAMLRSSSSPSRLSASGAWLAANENQTYAEP